MNVALRPPIVRMAASASADGARRAYRDSTIRICRLRPTCRNPKSRASATLQGVWRWALMVATAATILLCINQQFSLRFFIDYTQLNTEYFYLLIALMLPFTFLIFPGTETAPLDRIPWYDLLLFVATFAASIWLMMNIRKAAAVRLGVRRRAEKRHRRRPRDVVRADGGAAPHRRLEPAAERASRSRSIRCLPTPNGSARSAAPNPRSNRPPPITCCRAKACSAFRSRPLPTP